MNDIYVIEHVRALREDASRIVEAFDVIDSFKIERLKRPLLSSRSARSWRVLDTGILMHARREFDGNFKVSHGTFKYGW